MKALINDIAASIVAEVAGAGTWTIRKFDPVVRRVEDKKVLYVYGRRRRIGEFRTTGSRDDVYEVIIEYVEPAVEQIVDWQRDEAAELAVIDIADAIVAWADNHQSLGAAWRLDWFSTDYPADVRRELQVRHFMVTLTAHKVASYG